MGGQSLDFEGRRIAINSAIDALLNNKVSSQKIIIYLKETYGLSAEEAVATIENVGKSYNKSIDDSAFDKAISELFEEYAEAFKVLADGGVIEKNKSYES